LSKTLFYI